MRALSILSTAFSTALLLAASTGTAATLTLDLDQSVYQVGDDIIVTATLEATGTEFLITFESYVLEIGWDPAVASVKNAGELFAQGHATQQVVAGPGAGGSVLTYDGGLPISGPIPTYPCFADEAKCTVLFQNQEVFDPVTLDAQTLVGTLVLRADAAGALGESITQTDFVAGTDLVVGNNFGSAVVVPEPTTGLLVSLGLLGIAGARRRS
jgi:hypothetical protein